jgi:predicted nucleotidyltransferase
MPATIASRFESNIEAIRSLLKESGACLGYLFGSAAKGIERQDSDLDVAVLMGPEIRASRFGEVQLRLTTALVGLTHTNDVDVVILNSAPPLLAHQVISSGKCFFGNRRDQVRFEIRAIQRYIDTRRLRDHAARAFFARIPSRETREVEEGGPW